MIQTKIFDLHFLFLVPQNEQIYNYPCLIMAQCLWYCIAFHTFQCRYEVEVSIASSLDPNLLSSSKATAECPAITFTIPVNVVPPGVTSDPPLPDWTSLCLVALTEDEWAYSPRTTRKERSVSATNPCQSVSISGCKRGSASVTPRRVKGKWIYITKIIPHMLLNYFK